MKRLALMLLGCALLGACAPELPEPESEAARLYVQYCSGSNCHGALPPQRDGVRYWENQYARMIDLMRRQGVALPDERESRLIEDYLRRHAYRSDGK